MYINPYDSINDKKGLWLRTNFHTHAGTGKDTCGALEIDEVVEFYKMAGYGALTISNHDIFSDTGEYAKKHDIVMINGYEYSQASHMLCIGSDKVTFGTHQEAIDECSRSGGFTILCHPNWQRKEYWPWKEIDKLHGYMGIEIMNSVISRLNGTGLATDTWDYLLSQGKLVWGFGSDDFHRWFDLAKTWNMIYSGEDQKGVMEAVRNGSFYVSTGLELKKFEFENGLIRITAGMHDSYIKDYRYIFTGEGGKVLKEQQGECGEYLLNGDEAYVRVQVISEHGAMLWTQPVYKDSRLKRV